MNLVGEFEPCVDCKSPMACRDRNYCNRLEERTWREQHEGSFEPTPTVQVIVGGKTEQRAIDHIDTRTGLTWPQVRDGEEVLHTIDGKIYIIGGVR